MCSTRCRRPNFWRSFDRSHERPGYPIDVSDLNNDLKLAPPLPSSPLRGIVFAVAILGVIGTAWFYFFPQRSAHLTVMHVAVYPAHTVFQSPSIAVGTTTQDDLYVMAILRVQNGLKIPVFLKDFTATLTDADGQQLSTGAVEKPDFPVIYSNFPAVQALASAPLNRETAITPGASTEGMVMLHFPGTQEMWDKRKDAVLTVAFYHQEPLSVSIR
jgi:hypothetical protein